MPNTWCCYVNSIKQGSLVTLGCLALIASGSLLAATDEADTGESLYQAYCASFHDGSTSKAPHTDFVKMMAGDAIFKSMTEGIMRQQAAGLDEEQKTKIAEHLVAG